MRNVELKTYFMNEERSKITVLSIHFNELENKLQIIRSKEIIKITTGIENKFIIKKTSKKVDSSKRLMQF